MKVKLPLLTLAAILILGATVRADPVVLTIIPNPAIGNAGQTITLSLAFTNLGLDPVQIKDVVLSLSVGPGTSQFLTTLDPFLGRVIIFKETQVANIFSVIIFPTAKGGDLIVTNLRVDYDVISLNGTRTAASVTGTSNVKVVVPEPTTMLLLGTGLAGVAIKTRKRLKARKSGQERK